MSIRLENKPYYTGYHIRTKEETRIAQIKNTIKRLEKELELLTKKN
tara:strand:+ start:350 stop:487 length:138 start_codon:yes stop_codon:yes gene_type:complete